MGFQNINFNNVEMWLRTKTNSFGVHKPDNTSINYFFITRRKFLSEGSKEKVMYDVNFRFNQPCVGGEFTRYYEIHGEIADCNRYRPGDLYQPFPHDGDPVAVYWPLKALDNADQIPEINSWISNPEENVWLKAGGLKNPKVIGTKTTPLFKTETKGVDGTLMVNFIKMLYGRPTSSLKNSKDFLEGLCIKSKRFNNANPVRFLPDADYEATGVYARGGVNYVWEDSYADDQKPNPNG